MIRAPSFIMQGTGTNLVPFPSSSTPATMSPSRKPRVSNASGRRVDRLSQSPISSRHLVSGARYASLGSQPPRLPPSTPQKRPALPPTPSSNASTPTSKTTTDSAAMFSSTMLSDSTSISSASSSSSESAYEPSIILGRTRSRKISSAQEVAAKCRAVWAMREKLDTQANRWAMDDAPRWGSAGMMGGLAHGYRSTTSSDGSSAPSYNVDPSIDVDEQMMAPSEETRGPTLMEYPVPPQLALPLSVNSLPPNGIPFPVSRYLVSRENSPDAKENRGLAAIDTSVALSGGHIPPSPKARRRQSRADALERVMEEATLAMIHSNRPDGCIQCPREECSDILKSVKAVALHLHIHDIHDRLSPKEFSCDACGGMYESPRELGMHDCDRHRQVVGAAQPPLPKQSASTTLGHVNLNLNFSMPKPLTPHRARSTSASASGTGSGSQHWGPLRDGLKRIVSRATRRHDPLGAVY